MDHPTSRMAAPFTDAEIMDLYRKARTGKGPVVYKTYDHRRPWSLMSVISPIARAFLDIFALYALLVVIVNIFPTSSLELVNAVGTVFIYTPFVFFWIGLFYYGFALGPIGLTYLIRSRRQVSFSPIDAQDPTVLAEVVKYISAAPIERAKDLQLLINKQRDQIKSTVEELPSLIEAFESELKIATDANLRSILKSRLEASDQALTRLQEVDQELADQGRQAADAVEPILRIRSQFDRYRRLNQSLSKIEAAHNLADKSEAAAQENQLELRALQACSEDAQVRLAEIQSMVEATEQAREEVRQLMA